MGRVWIFKHYFGDKGTFKELADYYSKSQYRFEFKTIGELDNALQLLDKNGFDYELVEDLNGYLVQLPKCVKYAQVLKSSVAYEMLGDKRIFLMKNLPAVEEAVSLGAEIFEGVSPF